MVQYTHKARITKAHSNALYNRIPIDQKQYHLVELIDFCDKISIIKNRTINYHSGF